MRTHCRDRPKLVQFNPIPDPPDSLDRIAAVHEALPTEPDPELDCCARVIERTAVETREAAADWITFLRALEVVAKAPNGYRRAPMPGDVEPDSDVDGDPNLEQLARAFRDRVVGVDAVLSTLDDEDGLAAEVIYGQLVATDSIPTSDRRRYGDRLRSIWIDRIDRILEWATLFELVERVDGAYRRR